jgi:uncharacterized protein DUF4159
MKVKRWWVGAVILVTALTGTILYAQRFGRFGDRFNRSGFGMPSQNEPPDTEFVLARLHYRAGWGGGGWAHDYPTAEEHILQIMQEASGINVDRLSYRIVELGSPEVFKYPFTYISEPGEMQLSDQEVVNLREYIDRGGFIMVDDFGGQGQGRSEFERFRANLLRAFPDRDMFLLTEDHPLMNIFYHVDNLQMLHPMTNVPAIFYGYPDGKGGLSMVICYNNDVGDYWEFIDEPYYAVKPSAEALKLGINFVMYAMTH